MRRVEGSLHNTIEREEYGDVSSWDLWFQLDENLDADGEADAYTVDWSASANTGAGAYAANDGSGDTIVVVRDTTAQHCGLQYEWVRCRIIGSVNGPVREVMEGGAQWHRGTLAAQLNQGSSANCTVTIRSNSVTVLVYDVMLAADDHLDNGTIVIIFYNLETKHWEVLSAACAVAG